MSNLIVEACTWLVYFVWCSKFQDVSVDYIS